MSGEFWTFVHGFLVILFFLIWLGWIYQSLYSGFVCWILETIWWGVWTLNVINIFPEQ